jgi:hypothetical protein
MLDEEEKKIHRGALKQLENDLHLNEDNEDKLD